MSLTDNSIEKDWRIWSAREVDEGICPDHSSPPGIVTFDDACLPVPAYVEFITKRPEEDREPACDLELIFSGIPVEPDTSESEEPADAECVHNT